MSEASDRVMCKRMVRFGKDLVLDVNQVTAVEGINVYLDDGRHFDISQEAADKLQEWFAPGDKGSRNIDLFVTLKAAADAYKKFCDRQDSCDACKLSGSHCELEWALMQTGGTAGTAGTI